MKNLKLVFVGISVMLFNACIPVETDQSLEGEWTCTETSTIFMKSTNELKGTSIFPVYFAQDFANSNKYYIDNFYQLGAGNQGTITVSGSIVTLSSQVINGIQVVGSGTISADYNTLNLSYTADDGGGEIDQVTALYER